MSGKTHAQFAPDLLGDKRLSANHCGFSQAGQNGSLAEPAAGEPVYLAGVAVDLVDHAQYQGEQGAREAGRLRQEGKEYIVQDGDVIHFRFNV